jgi:hypothetical protein
MKRDSDRTYRVPFRSERTIRINGEWYYMTKEGLTADLFIGRSTAEQHADSCFHAVVPSESNLVSSALKP